MFLRFIGEKFKDGIQNLRNNRITMLKNEMGTQK